METHKIARSFPLKAQLNLAAQYFTSIFTQNPQPVEYYQAEQICSIGSGAFESTIKQIDRRIKISGAQWKRENVPQVLAHRCAYLNGRLAVA